MKMRRSQLFALIREALDMLSFTEAAIDLHISYEHRNGNGGDDLEIQRHGGHNIYHVVSTHTGVRVIDSGESSHVMHDLRALIDRNHNITRIGLVGPEPDAGFGNVVLYPYGGDQGLPLSQRRLQINQHSSLEESYGHMPEYLPLVRGESNVHSNSNENEDEND